MNGPKLCTLQKTAKTEESPSQSEPELMDITLALDLRPVESSTPEDRVKEETIQRPELSGEWARSKSYICSPCGQIFQDFLALMHHQKAAHSGVCCTNIQLEQSLDVTGLVKELGRQIMRPVSGGPTHSVTAFQCTKCHFTLQSVPELHSHILLCSNHVPVPTGSVTPKWIPFPGGIKSLESNWSGTAAFDFKPNKTFTHLSITTWSS